MSLLTPPSEHYLDEVAFFLSVGEQAPFKSPEDIDELSITSRNFWVEKLSEVYQKQQQEMQKSRSKRK